MSAPLSPAASRSSAAALPANGWIVSQHVLRDAATKTAAPYERVYSLFLKGKSPLALRSQRLLSRRLEGRAVCKRELAGKAQRGFQRRARTSRAARSPDSTAPSM